MSTTKPRKTASKQPARAPLASTPIVLTADEAELLRCYRAMDLRHRAEDLRMRQSNAEKYPMVKKPAVSVKVAPPGIRLVAAAGKRVAT